MHSSKFLPRMLALWMLVLSAFLLPSAQGQAQFIPKTPEDIGLPGAYANMFRTQRALRLPISQPALTAPTVTFVASNPGATPTTIAAYDRTNGRVDPRYTYYGYRVYQAGTTNPSYDAVTSALPPNSPTGFGASIAEFYSDASSLTIPYQRSQSGSFRILVDGVERAATGSGIVGTAQAGAASTITLASGASSTNGTYNTQWVYIGGGTGSGQYRQITGYVGSTRVATISPNWSTNPDATSTYIVSPMRTPFINQSSGASFYWVNFDFAGEKAWHHYRVEFAGYHFYGANINAQGALLLPVPKSLGTRCYWFGDSFSAGTGATLYTLALSSVACSLMGWEQTNLSIGSTGWLATGTGALTIGDRACPGVNSWRVVYGAGTFTLTQSGISVSIDSSTDTTAAAVQTKFNTAFGAGVFKVAGNTQSLYIVGQGATGDSTATLTATPGTVTPTITRYTGEMVPELVYDGNGKVQPSVIVLACGHNDTTSSGFTSVALQAEVTRVVNKLRKLYPNFVILVVGNMYTRTAGTDVTDANSAILAGLTATSYKINGTLPFINTQSPIPWVTGTGNITATTGAAPTVIGAVSADYVNGTDGIHPSPAGHIWFGTRLASEFGRILWGQ